MLDRAQHFASAWQFDALIHSLPGALPKMSGQEAVSMPAAAPLENSARADQVSSSLVSSAERSQAAFVSNFSPYFKLDEDLADRRRRNLKLALAFSDYTHQLRQVLRPLKTVDDLRHVLKGFLKIVGDVFAQVERHPDFEPVMSEYQAIVLKLDKLAPNEVTRLKILTEDLLMVILASIDRQEVVNDLDVARLKMNSGTMPPSNAEKELVRRFEFQRDAIDVRLAILLRDTATLCKIFRLH
jgi:hypothetical protein